MWVAATNVDKDLTCLTMLSRPSWVTDANSLSALSMSRAIGTDTLRSSDVTFGTFPALHTMALTTSVNPVVTAQSGADACKKIKVYRLKKDILFFQNEWHTSKDGNRNAAMFQIQYIYYFTKKNLRVWQDWESAHFMAFRNLLEVQIQCSTIPFNIKLNTKAFQSGFLELWGTMLLFFLIKMGLFYTPFLFSTLKQSDQFYNISTFGSGAKKR